MKERRVQQVRDVAMPHLRAGENIELVTIGRVGTVRRRKQVAVTVIAAILTLGMLTVVVMARPCYLVLTNQRLLCFAVARNSGKPLPQLVRDLPRTGMSATAPRRRLAMTFTISVAGMPGSLKLAFGLAQRKNAPELAKSIGISDPRENRNP